MTPQQQQTAAAEFAEFWAGKGDEKQETQRFWIQLLSEVLGIENPTKYIDGENHPKSGKLPLAFVPAKCKKAVTQKAPAINPPAIEVAVNLIEKAILSFFVFKTKSL